MPIRSLGLAAAAALLLGGVAAPAQAADEPLLGLPFLVDSAGKLVGPYLPNSAGTNSVLMQFDGRVVGVPANNVGFFEARYTLLFKSKDCSGPAFMSANTLPIAGVSSETIFFPAAERLQLTLKSRKEFVPGGGEPPCSDFVTSTGVFAKAVSQKIKDLGFKPPFELKAKAPK